MSIVDSKVLYSISKRCSVDCRLYQYKLENNMHLRFSVWIMFYMSTVGSQSETRTTFWFAKPGSAIQFFVLGTTVTFFQPAHSRHCCTVATRQFILAPPSHILWEESRHQKFGPLCRMFKLVHALNFNFDLVKQSCLRFVSKTWNQESWNAEMEEFRTGGRQDRTDAVQEGCSREDSGQVWCRKVEIQDRWDARK